MDVPASAEPIIITDAAINIFPTLEDKRDICQNAIDLARALGCEVPKVAVLSAVETVTAKIPSTLEAAALCKMAARGQITGGLVDGPLAFDNAVSEQAAQDKDIVSPVAGKANILLVPDLEAGSMLAKQLTFMAGADAAGIVLGCPGSDHLDQPRRQSQDPPGVGGSGGSACPRAAPSSRNGRCSGVNRNADSKSHARISKRNLMAIAGE